MNSLLNAGNFDSVGKILESYLGQFWSPLLIGITALGVLFGLAAGVKYWLAAQSGDEQKIKQAKTFAVGIIVGIAIMFLLAALVPVIIACFQSWYDNDAGEYVSVVVNSLC